MASSLSIASAIIGSGHLDLRLNQDLISNDSLQCLLTIDNGGFSLVMNRHQLSRYSAAVRNAVFQTRLATVVH